MIPNIQKPVVVFSLPKLPDISKHVEAVQRLQERLDPGKVIATKVGDAIETLKRAGDVTTCPPLSTESGLRGWVRKAVDWVRGFSFDARGALEPHTLESAPQIEVGRDGFRLDTGGEMAPIQGGVVVGEVRVRHDGDDVLRFRDEVTLTAGQPGFGIHAHRDPSTGVVSAGVEMRAPLVITPYGSTIATANAGVSVTADPAAAARAIAALL
jgi:hypothetical protein